MILNGLTIFGWKKEEIEVKEEETWNQEPQGMRLRENFSEDFEMGALNQPWTGDILKWREWGKGGFKKCYYGLQVEFPIAFK